MAAVEPPLSIRRCPSTGRQSAGRLSPGPMRRCAAQPVANASGHSTPLRQSPGSHPNGSVPMVAPVPSPMPRRLNSSSSTSIAADGGCNTAFPWGTGPMLGGRSLSTPTGLQAEKPECTAEVGCSQSSLTNISWQPPTTARGHETCPAPWAWQMPNGVQSPRAPAWPNPAQPLYTSPRAFEPANATYSSSSALVPPCVVAVPVQTRDPDAPRTARMSGSAMAPVAIPCQDGSFTARLSGSAMAPVAHPVDGSFSARLSGSAMAPVAHPVDGSFSARLSGSAMAPVAHPVPATTHKESVAAPPCAVAVPVQGQLVAYPTPVGSALAPPCLARPTQAMQQHNNLCIGSQASLAVDESQDHNHSAENVNPQISAGATPSGLSPRDTVWKRYFSSSHSVGADQQMSSAQPRGFAHSDKQMPSAIGMVCGISRNSKSPSGVPRLPLQAAATAGPQLCTPEGVPFDTLPATERSRSLSQSAVPAWCVPQVSADPFACHIEVASSCAEQVRLSEAHYAETSPRGSTATLPPATFCAPDVQVMMAQEEPQPCKTRTGPTLHQMMGQFGAPEPPASVDMANLPNVQASQGSAKEYSMLDARETSLLPSPSPMRETSVLPSPLPDSSTLPDDYMHSFVVATSPFSQCQSPEVTSFVQPPSESEVQPLQPRRRGLPGNTIVEDQEKIGGDSKQEYSMKKNRANAKSPPVEPEPLDDIASAAASISMRGLAELRSFRNPPVVVCQVLEPVAVLLGVPHKPWAKMRKLLDGTLLSKLNSFDPSIITPAQAERVKCLLQAPAFSDGSLHEKCPAALGLSQWCRAVVRSLPLPSLPASRNVSPAVEVQVAAPLNRPDLGGLYVEPDLWSMSEAELSRVRGLQFSREGVGALHFHGEVDVRDALHNLAEVVLLHPGEVVVYPTPSTKPPIGVGLNKAADITLFGCMPKTHNFRDQKAKDRYKRRVKQMTEDKGAEFVDYDCTQGIWKFRVNHF